MTKKKIMITGILLLTALVYLYVSYFPPFNETKWKSNKNRSAMLDYIINTKMLEKKSFDEVIALLGRQDFFDNTKTQEKESKNVTIAYLTYGTRWIGIDMETLKIEFRNDTVLKVYRHFN